MELVQQEAAALLGNEWIRLAAAARAERVDQMAVALGAVVGVYWRDDYAQCLARVGGFEKVLNGMCVSLP